MPKVTTKVKSKGVIKDFIKSMEGLKKPIGAKLVLPTEGDSSLTNLSWILMQEFGATGPYKIEPRPPNKALSFPASPDFINPPLKSKKGKRLKSIGGITNLDVAAPDDIYAGKVAVPFVIHPGFPPLHFIRDVLAEKRHDIEAVKIEIGDEIVGIGRKPSKRFDPQKIGKVLVKYLKEIKEEIAQRMEIVLPQKRFDDTGKLQGQEPADVFRKQVKVVSAAKFSDEDK